MSVDGCDGKGGGGSRGMLGVVGWPSKHVTLTDSVSAKRFAQEPSTLLIA